MRGLCMKSPDVRVCHTEKQIVVYGRPTVGHCTVVHISAHKLYNSKFDPKQYYK